MGLWRVWKKGMFFSLLFVLAVLTLLTVFYLTDKVDFSGSVSSEQYNSLKKRYHTELARLAKMNRQYSRKLSDAKKKLHEVLEERDALEHEKSRLLLMLEKLEKRWDAAAIRGDAEKIVKRYARSWLVRINQLRNDSIRDVSEARDAFIEETNQVIEGLKEDFPGDAFIARMNYCTVTSNVRKDVIKAKEKLHEVSKHLKEYYTEIYE